MGLIKCPEACSGDLYSREQLAASCARFGCQHFTNSLADLRARRERGQNQTTSYFAVARADWPDLLRKCGASSPISMFTTPRRRSAIFGNSSLSLSVFKLWCLTATVVK